MGGEIEERPVCVCGVCASVCVGAVGVLCGLVFHCEFSAKNRIKNLNGDGDR